MTGLFSWGERNLGELLRAVKSTLKSIFPFDLAARQSTDATNETVAVERVLEYRYLEPEPQPENPTEIAGDWPSQGCIVFKEVYYRYYAEAEPVLRGLTFDIQPKEKIGVVGRTGAGKSSLIGALYRLGCVTGEIIIDGIDTADIRLCDLRKQIANIPQDPVLFSGTLRKYFIRFSDVIGMSI